MCEVGPILKSAHTCISTQLSFKHQRSYYLGNTTSTITAAIAAVANNFIGKIIKYS